MSTTPSFVWNPETEPAVNSADWKYLIDLPIPPELALVIAEVMKRRGRMNPRGRVVVEEELKMQYHFSGQDVAYLATPRGRAIVVSGQLESEEFGRVLEALPRSVRTKITLYSLDHWHDPFQPDA